MYLHACRALAVCAVITGFFGGVLTLIGMKCTKIGGSELANSRVTFAGAVTYLASGKLNEEKKNKTLFLTKLQYVLQSDIIVVNFLNRVLWDDHILVVGQQSRLRIRGPKLQSTKVSTFKAALLIMQNTRRSISAVLMCLCNQCIGLNSGLHFSLAGEEPSCLSLEGSSSVIFLEGKDSNQGTM